MPTTAVRRDDPYDDQPYLAGDPGNGSGHPGNAGGVLADPAGGQSAGKPGVLIPSRRPGSAPGGDAVMADPGDGEIQAHGLPVRAVQSVKSAT